MNKIFPILLGSAGLLLLSGSASSSSGTSIPTKYIPPQQPDFYPKLKVILPYVENLLDCPYLANYFSCVGYVESRFVPSAIRYETGKGYHPDLFPKNPYIGQKYLWEYTGGLFQMFPYVALNTGDNMGNTLDPRLVFHPLYSIAFAIDFAYRLNKYYDADRWLYVRFGWRSLSTLKNKPLEEGEAVQNRMINAADELGINPQFLYQHPNFAVYEKYYKFKGLLNHLLIRYLKKK